MRTPTMPPPRNVAWLIRYDDIDDRECAEIAYARDGISAAKRTQSKAPIDLFDGDALSDGVTVERAPKYDHFAPRGPDAAALLDFGWHFHCNECEHEFDVYGCETCAEDAALAHGADADPDDFMLPVATRGRSAWCSERCRDASDARRAAREAMLRPAIEATKKRFPFATKVDATDWSNGTMIAEFRFPGGKYHASWTVGTDEVRVLPSDVEAWNAAIDAARLAQE